MKSEFEDFENWLEDTLVTLQPASRLKLLRILGARMRRDNQKRQTAQVGLDGAKWAARKSGARIKMMWRLKLNKNLKIRVSSNQVIVGWRGLMGGIARVHHFGLRDRVSTRGVRAKYQARELLGQANQDTDGLSEVIENWLDPS
jgi:phage virion morphogenesis protein